jgi:hypothetical protein
MTKFALMFVVFAALCGNAAAQDNVSLPDPNVGADTTGGGTDPTDQSFDRAAAYQQCLDESHGDVSVCCNGYADCQQAQTNLGSQVDQMFQAGYGQTLDERAAEDCRSRRGTWENGQCTCGGSNHWFGSTDAPEQCCTPNVRRYENRMHACQDSGGTWTCRGECRCPNDAQQLVNGVCEGDAMTREEIDRMRTRLPELESELARLQAERDALRTQLDQALGQLDEVDNLADTVGEMEQQLAEMDAELSFLRHLREQYEEFIARQAQTIADLGGIPPLPPGIPDEDEPFPGTAEAVAAAASGTAPGPMAPVPPPEEEEGNWCSENGWACAGIIIAALAGAGGLTVGIVEATRDIEVTQ